MIKSWLKALSPLHGLRIPSKGEVGKGRGERDRERVGWVTEALKAMRDTDVLKVMIAYTKEHGTWLIDWLIDEFKRQLSFLLNEIWIQASILPFYLISLLFIFYHICNGTRSWGLTSITQHPLWKYFVWNETNCDCTVGLTRLFPQQLWA